MKPSGEKLIDIKMESFKFIMRPDLFLMISDFFTNGMPDYEKSEEKPYSYNMD